jgi:hypothetical protein
VIARYYGKFNKSRRDRWVFGDRSSGAYMQKFAWNRIIRHQMVKGEASPDDPALAEYWAKRRRKTPPPIGNARLGYGSTEPSTVGARSAEACSCPSMSSHKPHASGSTG